MSAKTETKPKAKPEAKKPAEKLSESKPAKPAASVAELEQLRESHASLLAEVETMRAERAREKRDAARLAILAESKTELGPRLLESYLGAETEEKASEILAEVAKLTESKPTSRVPGNEKPTTKINSADSLGAFLKGE